MDLEKDHFDDETELSPLEEEDLGGDSDEIADAEEELIVADDDSDEEEGTPAAKPAGKAAAKKPAAAKPGVPTSFPKCPLPCEGTDAQSRHRPRGDRSSTSRSTWSEWQSSR